jgi:hypothetical protein
LRHDAALVATLVANRRLLDDEPSFGDVYLERRVIEVARWAPPNTGSHGLKHPPVETDELTARAEREPEQVHRGRPLISRVAREYASDSCRHASSFARPRAASRDQTPTRDDER